jgi:hypothetical protein
MTDILPFTDCPSRGSNLSSDLFETSRRRGILKANNNAGLMDLKMAL